MSHHSRRVSPSLMGAWLILAAAVAAGAAEPHYTVSVTPALDRLEVHGCLPSPAPAALVADGDDAAAYLQEFRVEGKRIDLRTATGRLPLPARADGACFHYRVAMPSPDRQWFAPPAGSSTLLDPAAWLWRPPGQVLRIRFDLPPGMDVSAPWPQDGPGRYTVSSTPIGPALMAVGRLQRDDLRVAGATLRLARPKTSAGLDARMLRRWIREGAQAVAAAYGCFPVAAPQLLVVPVGRSDEPVPWGQVQRGGGPAVHLFIDETRSAAEFREDWVLVHELSHLLHPDFDGDSAWLGEGLASYYQNVLRARTGLMSGLEAWQKLHEGFQRGIGEVRPGVSLVEATRRMRREREYMRVYWSGAAIALLADLAYRAAGASLDQALLRFRDCCLDEYREWTAAEFFRALDAAVGVDAGSALLRRFADSDRFPDVSAAYRRLGLAIRGSDVELQEHGALLRHAITGVAGRYCGAGDPPRGEEAAATPPP